ncbi:hypothetical protein CK203_033342 [Vitis vinifera]|uniref:Reverse transcriptase zinc-binding domain-containing protein n=1 Tax=Vitis vinifera TaxID=29760 RepID=A0A438HMR5_VITVI|nr:hypothetical protein CK203_033342 [Vitis vinifera]
MGERFMDCFSQWGKEGGSWNPRFTRRFNDWELHEVENLLGRLCGAKVMLDEEDRLRWLLSKDGNFSTKISFFAWEASWGKALNFRPNSDERMGFSK